jgi:hypothetical protein
MPLTKAGEFSVEFFAQPSAPDVWPVSWSAISKGPLENAKLAAKSTYVQKYFPWAVSYKILDHQDKVVYEWPEAPLAKD